MKNILTNWTFMRAFRLVLGIAILIQAVTQRDMLPGLLALFLLGTALANIGCCSSNGCAVNLNQYKAKKDFTYEKMDAEK